MLKARLLHPTSVKIRKRIIGEVDELFRETKEEYSEPVDIKAQLSATVTSRRFAEENLQQFGDIGEGTLIFIIDAETFKQHEIKIEDKVIEVSGLQLDYYVRAIIPIAHYSGVPNLYKIIASPFRIR